MTVHWTIKLGTFVASVVTLSWFFAGWRQVHEAATVGNWMLLAGGIVATLLLVALQGYWIYFEEKRKGTLRRRIEVFERIAAAIGSDPAQVALASAKGDTEIDE